MPDERVLDDPTFPEADLVPITASLALFPTIDLVEDEAEFLPIIVLLFDDPERPPLLFVFIPYLTALEPPRRPV